MITNISIRIEDDNILNGGVMEGAILIKIHNDNPDWVQISSSINEGECISFPKNLLDDVVDALMLVRGDQ
jgi:hypothetical protein